ncbi:hypothetical protein RIF29_41516 [Crotalaria pallida]|uniref:C2H2-type domain-containing protein n=1 Tax=Crotalaria pallida TaxID=3830 RepID=A0AAN9HRQ2_CROPI
MHEVWLSLKRMLICKPHPNQVHDPKASKHQRSAQRTKSGSDGLHRTRSCTHSRIVHHVDYNEGNMSMDSDGSSILTCDKCGEKLKNHAAIEAHHISEHSVTEVQEESSRQIIETICGSGTSSINSENMSGEIDCILKVQNTLKTLACFEEYREMIKSKAEKLLKKHPRCVADGNELLRFHGTTIACSLGINSCYSLCTLDYCGICQILRQGFSLNMEIQGALGVYTTSTCGKAFDSIKLSDVRPIPRKSVIVCRVIAGRVSSPLEDIQEKVDSLAEKISVHSDIEELYLLNPNALLPCFVLIYKQHSMEVKSNTCVGIEFFSCFPSISKGNAGGTGIGLHPSTSGVY